jgi:hypothetical protein
VDDIALMLDDVVEEALRLVAVSESKGVVARLLGGTAIQALARRAACTAFAREPADIDLICPRGAGRPLGSVLAAAGYRQAEMFNAVNGHRRLLFFDDAHGRQVDVFIGEFAMCHSIPLEGRLELASPTLPLAELLLMKLQIVELNSKDQNDVMALLTCAQVADHDDQTVNGRYVAELCRNDWGLWRTITMNLVRMREATMARPTPSAMEARICRQLAELESMVEQAPKTRKWRLRAKVGERVRWYEQPEEVA